MAYRPACRACRAVADTGTGRQARRNPARFAGDTKDGLVSPGDTIGAHNIKADPRFVDAAAWDFRLQPDSPCIGAGDPQHPGKPSGKAPSVGLYAAPK